jgi:flagellin
MAFSINTNIASMQAQEYLRVNQDFQSKTINRVTSGLRIVSSGDDAAGLAIANTFRSDRAVLAQGIRNANDGLSTLQTIDGGINNISQLLDRARTLAAQSASGTFTGSRGVLNKEFESVVSEINRQSQSIGLDSGGLFAKSLSVFIGGGRANNGIAATQNGAIGVNLSNSTVDARSLGLKGVQAVGTAGTDIGSGAVGTKVTDISGNTTNTDSVKTAGFTDFFFQGPGFGDGSRVKVSVNTAGITDADTLASAVNSAIAGAGNGNSSAATAFRNAGIRASVNTDATGGKQLAFSSSTSAFQVQAGDQLSAALLGKFERNAALTGTNTSATVATNGGGTAADLTLKIDGGTAFTVSVTSGATTSKGQIVKDLNANTTFAASATAYLDGNEIVLRSKANSATSSVEISTATTLSGNLGLTGTASAASASTGASLATRVQAATETASGSSTFGAAGAGTIKIRLTGASLSSPVDVELNVSSSTTVSEALTNLQSSISSNSQLADARISLSTASAGNTLVFTSQGGEKFQVAVSGDVQNKLGFGSFQAGAAGEVDYSTLQAVTYNPTTSAAGTNAQLQFSIDGGAASTNAVTVDLTAGDATAATVASSDTGTGVVNITGNNNKLNLVVNGTNVNVTLTAGARTKSDIANAINTALGANGTAKVSGNAITLESSVKGAGGSIQVVSGTANTDLGFSASATPTVGTSRSGASVAAALNTSFAADTQLQAAGLQATFSAGKITVASNNGTNFRLNSLGSTTAAAVTGTASDTVAATNGKSAVANNGPFTIVSGTSNTLNVNADGAGAVAIDLGSGTYTAAQAAAYLNNGRLTGAILGNTNGATASVDSSGKLTITSNTVGAASTIALTGNALTVLGAQTATAGAAAQTSQLAIGASSNKLRISVDGGTAVDVTLTTTVGSSAATLAADAQTQVNAALLAAGQTSTVAVTASGNGIKFASASSGAGSSIAFSTITNDAYTAIGLTSGTTYTGTEANLGYGTAGASFTGNVESSAPTTSTRINSGGAAATQSVAFSDLANGSDDQVVTITANDASGASQSLAVTLRNDATSRSGRSLDESLKAINDALQQSNNVTLQKIVAVKDNSSGTEKISFASTLGSFKVSVGTSANGNGIDSQGATLDSAVSAGGAVVDISSQETAEAAVNSLAEAVSKLGDSQAVVGRAQNQFNFAISLAQTQLSNLAASESRIRDADLAQEAANLTKAQVLQQAGIAALAQANSAPQAVLSLLRG